MILTKDLAEKFLTALEKDLEVVNTSINGTNASIYNFAGYRNGQPVGISRTAQLSLNRGGQILQFLAGYYTSTTDTSTKTRIAKATAKVYNVFSNRPVFTAQPASNAENFDKVGQFNNDPSGSSMFLGLIMIDKQGILDNSTFATYCNSTPSYIRTYQIPRQALKVERALSFSNVAYQEMVQGKNHVWATQKMFTYALNGCAMNLSLLSLYYKMYGVSYYSKYYSNAYTAFRNIGTKFGTTYDSAGNEITVSVAGGSAGAKLCLAVGGNKQGRGAFPSAGYNAFVVLGMVLQAFAEKATTSSKFSDLKTAVANHPVHIDALKVMNYYRDRVASDKFIYELGAHRNFPHDAKRFRDAWKAELMRQGLTDSEAESTLKASAQFDVLLDKATYPAQAGYVYNMMWCMPTHSLFTNLANAYAYPASGKTALDIDYSKVGSEASVAEAFASTSEATAVRIASGLGIALIQGVTSFN